MYFSVYTNKQKNVFRNQNICTDWNTYVNIIQTVFKYKNRVRVLISDRLFRSNSLQERFVRVGVGTIKTTWDGPGKDVNRLCSDFRKEINGVVLDANRDGE